MKKYYCPYCGKLCLTNAGKFGGRYSRRHRYCPECNIPLGRKRHPLFWLSTTACILGFMLFYSCNFPYALTVVIAILLVSFNTLTSQTFIKITVKGDSEVPKNSFRCEVEFNEKVRTPRLYFSSVAVVIAKIGDDMYPIRIEPNSIHKKSAVCRFYIINESKKPDIDRRTIEFYDDDRLIAKGFMLD